MQTKRFDLVALGEPLIEFHHLGDATYKASASGDVLNTLYYAARLGLKTGLITATGGDPFVKHIYDLLEREGIDHSQALSIPDKSCGVYFKHLGAHGEPQFHFARRDSAATETLLRADVNSLTEYIAESSYFLFSAIGLAILKGRDRLRAMLNDVHGRTAICFDTNFRAALWNDPQELAYAMEDIAYLIDILFVTDRDDHAIYGERSMADAFRYYRSKGFQNVVYKAGDKGSAVVQDQMILEASAVRELAVVDATGAGDAFNAGFIAGQMKKYGAFDAALFGNAAGAAKIEEAGGIAPNFSRERVEKYYDQLKNK